MRVLQTDTSSPCALCSSAHRLDEPCGTVIRATGGTSPYGLQLPWLRAVPADSFVGTRVGNFTVVRRLASGAMGAVYLGEHEAIHRRVAIKLLHPHLAEDVGLVERFWAEALAVNLIEHDNIVSVFDLVVVPPNRYCLVMEYLEGRTLESLCGAPFAAARAVGILAQVLDALGAAHSHGIFHRDLKPANIFILRRGGRQEFVKVLDFGIAKLSGVEHRRYETSVNEVLGTPLYMAPEQSGGHSIDGRADVYSVGVIAYRLLTGLLPFDKGSVAEVLLAHRMRPVTPPHLVEPSILPALSAVVSRALEKRPDDRFASAAEMRSALEAALHPASPPLPKRAPVGLGCRVVISDGSTIDGTLCDETKRGAFIRTTQRLPALNSSVTVQRAEPAGAAPRSADVVLCVDEQHANGWGMPAGFAVQFRPEPCAGAPLRRPCETPVPTVAEAKAAFSRIRQRGGTDHYAVLDLPSDASFEAIAERVVLIRAELELLRESAAGEKQRSELGAADGRLRAAADVLGAPGRRADYDGNHGNFRGVARCVAAGLSAADLELLRLRFVQYHRPEIQRAHGLFMEARDAEAASSPALALERLQKALELDPLNLELQRRYWALRRAHPETTAAEGPEDHWRAAP